MRSAVCDPPTVPSRFCSTKRTRFLSMRLARRRLRVQTATQLLTWAGSGVETGEHFTRVLRSSEIRLQFQRLFERTTPQVGLPGLHVSQAEMILGDRIGWISLDASHERLHGGRRKPFSVVRPPECVEHLRCVGKRFRGQLRELKRAVEILA